MAVRLVIPFLSCSQRTFIKRLPLLVGRFQETRLRIVPHGVSRRPIELVGCDDEGELDDFFKSLP